MKIRPERLRRLKSQAFSKLPGCPQVRSDSPSRWYLFPKNEEMLNCSLTGWNEYNSLAIPQPSLGKIEDMLKSRLPASGCPIYPNLNGNVMFLKYIYFIPDAPPGKKRLGTKIAE